MSITLELPETELAPIRAAASAHGQSLESYILASVALRARIENDGEAALDALVEAMPDYRKRAGLGVLPDESLSRAAFYEDEERGTEGERAN